MRNILTGLIILLVVGAFMVGCERKVTETVYVTNGQGSDDCFTCHGSEGYLLQAKGEWANSVHASGASIDYTNRGGSDCTQCHNHQGFLEFVETGAVSAPYESVSAIHCFTCHSPHETGDLSLRTTAAVELVDGSTYDHNESNLCVACHHARTSPAAITDGFNVTSTHWGPHHGPQGDMIEGADIGYKFAGYTYTTSNHKNGIQKVCIQCHMGNPNIHEGYDVGGHSFNIQDEDGNNISGVCSDCHSGANKLDWTADADYDHDGTIEGYQSEIDGLADSLAVLLVAEGVLGGDATNGYHPNTGVIADGDVAGALWNFLLVVNEDRSHGIHNFNYTQGLLQSSIEYVSGL